MLRRHLWNAVFFAILLSLSSCYVTAEDKKFELGGKEGSATAIVEKERLKLEVAPGDKENYPKTFELKIGDCLVGIKAESISDGVLCSLTANGEEEGDVRGLKSIVASPSRIMFSGIGKNPIRVECVVKFGEQKDGKYYIPVQLSGDVPEGFKLSSESANMTEPAKSEGDDKKAHLGLILGIVGGSVAGLIFLIGSSIAGFCIYRSHKNKVLQKDRTQLSTAKSMEEAISKTPEIKPLESKTSETKPLEVDSKQAAPTSNSDKDKKKRKSSESKKKRKSSESKKKRDSDDGTDKRKRKYDEGKKKRKSDEGKDKKKRKADDKKAPKSSSARKESRLEIKESDGETAKLKNSLERRAEEREWTEKFGHPYLENGEWRTPHSRLIKYYKPVLL